MGLIYICRMKEEKIVIDGEIYISSRRASKQSGYASDYITFLAREGKIKSRIIGRTRFISEKSLANYKPLLISAASLERKERPAAFTSPVPAKVPANFNIVRSLVLAAILISLILPPTINQLAEYLFDFYPINPKALTVAAVKSGFSFPEVVSKIKIESVELDRKFLSYLDLTSGQINNFLNSAQAKLVRLASRIKNIFASRTLVFVDRKTQIQPEIAPLDQKEQKEIQEPIQPEQTPETGRLGLGVLPTTGDAETDRSLIEKIRESFSDEVTVRYDQSRKAGVITPVFRDRAEDNYIFVLVPVQEIKNDI